MIWWSRSITWRVMKIAKIVISNLWTTPNMMLLILQFMNLSLAVGYHVMQANIIKHYVSVDQIFREWRKFQWLIETESVNFEYIWHNAQPTNTFDITLSLMNICRQYKKFYIIQFWYRSISKIREKINKILFQVIIRAFIFPRNYY